MNRFSLAALSLVAISAASSAQTIAVSAAFAPNAYGSSNWDTWRTNTLSALVSGQNQSGTTGTSAYYSNIAGSSFDVRDNIVTNFDSWRGYAPGTYSPEYGTRIHFPVKMVSATAFSLSQVNFEMSSTDAGNGLGYMGDLSGTNFGSGSRRGVNYGADGLLGGGDDTIYDISNPGTDTTLINELEYVGIGNAFEALTSDLGATNQDKINGVVASIDPYTVQTQYTITGQGGGAFATVNFAQAVPEPASFAALGLGALGFLRRQRRK